MLFPMLQSVDTLLYLIKRKVDYLIIDGKLQKFIKWISIKTREFNHLHDNCYKQVTIRAYYLQIDDNLAIDLSLVICTENNLTSYSLSSASSKLMSNPYLNLDFALTRALGLFYRRFPQDYDSVNLNSSVLLMHLSAVIQQLHNFELPLKPLLKKNLLREIRELITQLPSAFISQLPTELMLHLHGELQEILLKYQPEIQLTQQSNTENNNSDESRKKLWNWWQAEGQTWAEKLKTIMIKYRNIGFQWDFSEKQWEILQQYYNANRLLIDCLNGDCIVSDDVRKEIEETLLLPMAEIKK